MNKIKKKSYLFRLDCHLVYVMLKKKLIKFKKSRLVDSNQASEKNVEQSIHWFEI